MKTTKTGSLVIIVACWAITLPLSAIARGQQASRVPDSNRDASRPVAAVDLSVQSDVAESASQPESSRPDDGRRAMHAASQIHPKNQPPAARYWPVLNANAELPENTDSNSGFTTWSLLPSPWFASTPTVVFWPSPESEPPPQVATKENESNLVVRTDSLNDIPRGWSPSDPKLLQTLQDKQSELSPQQQSDPYPFAPLRSELGSGLTPFPPSFPSPFLKAAFPFPEAGSRELRSPKHPRGRLRHLRDALLNSTPN
jgi:hypothetical protein